MSESEKDIKQTILAKPLEITPAMFNGRGVLDLVDNLDKELRAIALDGSTKEGRQQCITLAANVRSSKAHIDEVGKGLVKPLKDKAKIIDEQRKEVRDKLDALAEHLRQPATEWEAKEERRISGHREALQKILALKEGIEFLSIQQVESRMKAIEDYRARDFQEYANDAGIYMKGIEVALSGALAVAKQREADAAELARLRAKEAADRAKEAQQAQMPVQTQPAPVQPYQQPPMAVAAAPVMQPVAQPSATVQNTRERCRVVHNAIADALVEKLQITGDLAQSIVVAIVRKQIPHTYINYEAN